MKGGHSPEFWAITLDPREAAALCFILKDMRHYFQEGKFGMNELEDETCEALIKILEDANPAAAGAGHGIESIP